MKAIDKAIKACDSSWTDIYKQFTDLADKYFPNFNKINSEVAMLYKKHKGDPDWDMAFKKWHNNNGVK